MGCHLWGHTESETTEATLQQQRFLKQNTEINNYKKKKKKISWISSKLNVLIKSHCEENIKTTDWEKYLKYIHTTKDLCLDFKIKV